MFPRAHITLGMCIAVIIGYFWNRSAKRIVVNIYYLMFLGAIAGAFPDMDSIMPMFIEQVPYGGEHRGLYTHSLFGIFVWPIWLAIMTGGAHTLVKNPKRKLDTFKLIYVTTLAAFLSHIITDLIEYYPTPILYPFTETRYYGFVPEGIHEMVLPYTILALINITIVAFFLYKDRVQRSNIRS